MRRRWPSLCTVTITLTNLLSFNGDFSFEKSQVAGSWIWAVGGPTDLGDVTPCQKSIHESCRMGSHIFVLKLICSLCHCECDGHTVHKLCQRRLTAHWLAPRDSDHWKKRSKVSSDWLASYIKATWPVLEIFEMAGHFPDSPRMIKPYKNISISNHKCGNHFFFLSSWFRAS